MTSRDDFVCDNLAIEFHMEQPVRGPLRAVVIMRHRL
jgi:hypothetical protein